MIQIAATGRTAAVKFLGRSFNVVIASDPSGSTIKLEFSPDGGTTWYVHYQDGNESAYTGRDFDFVRNVTDYLWCLNCTTYNNTPFYADLRGQ